MKGLTDWLGGMMDGLGGLIDGLPFTGSGLICELGDSTDWLGSLTDRLGLSGMADFPDNLVDFSSNSLGRSGDFSDNLPGGSGWLSGQVIATTLLDEGNPVAKDEVADYQITINFSAYEMIYPVQAYVLSSEKKRKQLQ